MVFRETEERLEFRKTAKVFQDNRNDHPAINEKWLYELTFDFTGIVEDLELYGGASRTEFRRIEKMKFYFCEIAKISRKAAGWKSKILAEPEAGINPTCLMANI